MVRFGTFFDGDLTRQERACLRSFARHGHDVTVFAYGALDLPDGVRWADARAILPQDRLYRAQRGPHRGAIGQFANHFRYVMIRQTGLAWIDTDLVCLRPDWPARDWLIGRQDEFLVNNAVLGCPSDHPALLQAIRVAEQLAGIDAWGLTGPHLLTVLTWEYDLRGEILPANIFYPLHHSRAHILLRPLGPDERLELPPEALCIHLWNEMLRMDGYDRRAGPPPGSALAALLDYAETL